MNGLDGSNYYSQRLNLESSSPFEHSESRRPTRRFPQLDWVLTILVKKIVLPKHPLCFQGRDHISGFLIPKIRFSIAKLFDYSILSAQKNTMDRQCSF